MTSERGRQALLLIAGAGAVVVMLDLSTLANPIGLAATIIAAALTPPRRGAAGGESDWWSMLMLGAAICLVGVPVQLGLEGIGGLLSAVGGILVVVGAALGFPLDSSRGEDVGVGSA